MPVAIVAIIPAILAFLGILAGNKWLVLLSAGAFIYFMGAFVEIPFFIWIILAIIFFYWITSQGKGK